MCHASSSHGEPLRFYEQGWPNINEPRCGVIILNTGRQAEAIGCGKPGSVHHIFELFESDADEKRFA
jgi:hypothetical protein